MATNAAAKPAPAVKTSSYSPKNNFEADLALEFGKHSIVVLSRGFVRLLHDLFGSGDSFIGFLLLHAGRRRPGFLDELGRLRVGLRHHFLALGFGPRQFRVDSLGRGQALRDLFTPHFQHLEDWSIGVPVKDHAHDAEAGYLCKQLRPVQAEGRDDPLDGSATAGLHDHLRH